MVATLSRNIIELMLELLYAQQPFMMLESLSLPLSLFNPNSLTSNPLVAPQTLVSVLCPKSPDKLSLPKKN